MTLPVALAGNDVIGQAKTGTGKTLGFGLPLLERVTVPADVEAGRAQPEQLTDAPQALVVVPTRELCTQVTNDLLTAGKVRNVRVLAIYGGRAYEPQVEALKKGIDVVVGTPGRLLDLAGQKKLNLKHVRALVLDEADEMLDLGFLPDVEKIMNMLPVRRQTMLFSATMPGAVIGLARRYMSQPTHIRATTPDDAGATVANTAQFVYRAHNMDKPEMVARILQADGRGLAMVFCRTKRTAADLADQLQQRGFASGAVHGDLGQGAREQALRAFRNGKVDVLVCTDVAARGIDVEGVTHVINYQSPEDEKTYLHRIGRTGRAGAKGIAITLVDWDDIPRWQLINKALNLGFNDPPETYSTSPHLFEELSIPAGTKGVLPRSERTRAGLSAEVVEDLGETGGRGARGGRGGRPSAGPAPAAERGRDRDRDRDRDRSERTPRRRRRTRNGTALDAAEPQNTSRTAAQSAPETVIDGTEPGRATESRTPRRRRRTRAAGSEAAASAVATSENTAVEVPEPAAVPAVVPVAEPVADAEAKPRRRRTRRTAEVAQPEAVVVEEAPKAEPTVVTEVAEPAEAVVTKPRRRTRKAAVAEPAVAAVEAVADPVEAVEAKPRRTRKATTAKAAAAETVLDTAEAVEAKPRRRTRKAAAATETAEVTAVAEAGIPAQATEEPEAKPRRRTRKAAATAVTAVTAETDPAAPAAVVAPVVEEAPVEETKPRRRTRKATVAAETAVDAAEGTTAEAPAAAVTKPRRTRKAAAPVEAAESAVDTAEAAEAKPRRRTRKAAVAEADIPAQATEAAADTAEAPVKPRRTRKTAAKTAAKATATDAVTEPVAAEAAAEAKPRRRTRKAAAAVEPTEG
ncbi:DEAD/DEAH box helicase [Streptomyces sp. NPDC047070]|uniref:DEAD/DEAH box helicase n=1 Tax=Streptomyces sp. NPDC047070 TaxID=3154923 RepID=UPI0034560A91